MKMYESELERVIEAKIKPNLKSVYKLRTHGLTDKYIAKYLGISYHMFMKALEAFEPLKEIYDDATLLLASQLRQTVINRALGEDGKVDKDGNPVGPDANLAFKLLEKFDPAFSKKETVNIEVTVEDVIKKISRKRKEQTSQSESGDEDDEEIKTVS